MYDDILNLLPYKSSFRFVDHISLLTLDEVRGDYTLRKNAFFYEDHFPGNPVTPGVIITEIMAQIGVVILGLNLIVHGKGEKDISAASNIIPLLFSTEVSFYKMVLPGEKVFVISRKQYFRFNKLKCAVEMYNASDELVAKGIFSGFIKQIEKT
ncbi:MAG: hydroxymyristoyl-ACP dehydratase [Bacteroidota bacterium]